MKKQPKKVVAKFTGKGFSLTADGKISHKSSVMHLSKETFEDDLFDKLILEHLNIMAPAIVSCLKNKRIQPGSIRITFNVLEK